MPTVFAGNNSLRKRARRGGLDKQVFQKAVLFEDLIFLASSQKTYKKDFNQTVCFLNLK